MLLRLLVCRVLLARYQRGAGAARLLRNAGPRDPRSPSGIRGHGLSGQAVPAPRGTRARLPGVGWERTTRGALDGIEHIHNDTRGAEEKDRDSQRYGRSMSEQPAPRRSAGDPAGLGLALGRQSWGRCPPGSSCPARGRSRGASPSPARPRGGVAVRCAPSRRLPLTFAPRQRCVLALSSRLPNAFVCICPGSGDPRESRAQRRRRVSSCPWKPVGPEVSAELRASPRAARPAYGPRGRARRVGGAPGAGRRGRPAAARGVRRRSGAAPPAPAPAELPPAAVLNFSAAAWWLHQHTRPPGRAGPRPRMVRAAPRRSPRADPHPEPARARSRRPEPGAAGAQRPARPGPGAAAAPGQVKMPSAQPEGERSLRLPLCSSWGHSAGSCKLN